MAKKFASIRKLVKRLSDMLKEKYTKEIVPQLMKKFEIKNRMAAPRILKVSLNVGIKNENSKDGKYVETIEDTLTRITGQKPVRTLAKKSIAGFKIREGNLVGMKVTLRGDRMWDFLDKLVNITFPRVRDFRGISSKIVDKQGNLSVGFKEYISFPEIKPDEVERLHGLQVTVTTTAGDDEKGVELFTLMGFPFKKA